MPTVPTKFENTTARGLRVTETGKSTAQFSNACNPAASNSPGIGITVPQTDLPAPTDHGEGWNWTLLTQGFINPNNSPTPVAPAARTPQVGQVIGGNGYVDRSPATTYPGSGGVSGNGAAPNAQTQFIVGVTNPDNVDGQPDPDYPAPTVDGSAQLATLAAGWVLV